MDIFRSFSLSHETDEETQEVRSKLNMFSGIEGEYGPVSLNVCCFIDSRWPDLHSSFVQTSGSHPGVLVPFLCSEVAYFVTNILPLFNSLTPLSHGLSQTSQDESPDTE